MFGVVDYVYSNISSKGLPSLNKFIDIIRVNSTEMCKKQKVKNLFSGQLVNWLWLSDKISIIILVK
jgi:hypothetical protein